DFGGGEEARGDLLVGAIGADLLDVDADLAVPGHRVDREIARVSQIEAKRAPARAVRERRLAPGAVLEPELFRGAMEIAAEENPQHTAPHGVAPGVARKVKALGP